MIVDNFLTEMAKAMNGESTNMPSHLAYGSTTMTISTDTSSITGEFGSRDSITGARTTNVVTFNGLKSGSTVGSSGETLFTFSLWNSSGSGDLHSAVLVPSILHTSSFDIDTDWQFTVTRVST